MITWVKSNVQLAIAIACVTLILGLGSYVFFKVRESGRLDEQRRNEQLDRAAAEAARRARDAHNAACIDNRPECLRDPWTRD